MASKLPALKKKLWIVFSKYIRERDKYTCFTCGVMGSGSGMHAGHFIPRGAGGLALFFHEDNVHAQCAKCNLFLQGNTYEYGVKLGKRKVAELYKLKNQITQWSEKDYLDKIEYYKNKLKDYEELVSGSRRARTNPTSGGQGESPSDGDDWTEGKESSL